MFAEGLPLAPDVPARPHESGCSRVPGAEALRAGGPLHAAWQRLELDASLPTQAWRFGAALAGTLLGPEQIEVFAATQDGVIAALLPLCRASNPFARWRMAGARELFEPGDVLGHDYAALTRLADALAAQGRPLVFDRLPARSPLLPLIERAMHGRAWTSVRPAMPSPTIALDLGWRSPEACFNSGRRSDFRRYARRAAEQGAVTYEVVSPSPDTFDALFDEAVAVEFASWKAEAGTAIASERPKEAFFRAFFRDAAEAGLLRIAFLRIDGQAAAMQMALEQGGRFWLFKIGYDERFAKCSPGTLLMLHTLRHAAEAGLTSYELLGEIEPWIAAFWTQDSHPCVKLRTYPANLRGAVAFIADSLTWGLGRLRPKRKAAP